jgi:hypothetical protein
MSAGITGTRVNGSYIKLYVEHVCSSGTTWGRREMKRE